MAEPQSEAEKAVELFHSYHVYVFLKSVSEASGRLNAALEQIKAAGLPIPPAPTSVPAFPNDVVGSQQTVSASPSGSGLQLLAAAATPTASAAAQQAWMSPAAGGAAAATLQALFGGGQQTPSAGLSAEGLASLSGLLLSPAKPASPAKPSAASLAQSLAAATSTPLVPLTPTAKKSTTPRKRPATDDIAGTSRAAAGPSTTPPDGTRSMKRKVQVVQRTSWPKPGAQAPDWNKRAAALAAVAAAAEREAAGDSDSATTNSETELAGGNDGGDHSSRAVNLGTWTENEKRNLVNAVRELNPCGAGEWEAVAERLGRVRGGSSAERMYRTLTDPAYHKSSNPHGRRLNPRKGSTPMHVMAAYALQRLPGNEGNLSQIGDLIKNNPHFSKELDWSPRPGTKTYPRWKDALVGCFKPGRYPHLIKTERKTDGLTVYRLDPTKVSAPYTGAK
mmetsp:Transcript_30992/g.79562  ORF Transcript_30992/g.79562 Transcript_30992/m.79562 type:complete len:448 (+) Transcript_30992:262-1605(+)|eukprot:jgi/Tetstr1/427320/TSEL_017489.t1